MFYRKPRKNSLDAEKNIPPLIAVGGVSNLPKTNEPSSFTCNLLESPFPSFSDTKNGPSKESEPLIIAEPVYGNVMTIFQLVVKLGLAESFNM